MLLSDTCPDECQNRRKVIKLHRFLIHMKGNLCIRRCLCDSVICTCPFFLFLMISSYLKIFENFGWIMKLTMIVILVLIIINDLILLPGSSEFYILSTMQK